MVGIGVVSVMQYSLITYDEENLIKEYCITETTPIPTIYDERMLSKNAASQKPYQNPPSTMR
jgi:hypothetical protein